MEEDRKGKPAAMIGGMYAKAKQRVLNKMGKRTSLTRNPRVDFISKRVEDIKAKKSRVSTLARTAQHQLSSVRRTLHELDTAMLEAFNDELGERKWDDEKATYKRELNPEERHLVSDMERVFTRCRDTMDKVLVAYEKHLAETEEKPLTYNTPDEETRLATVMQTKEEYKAVRTVYSDAMIDVDADLSTGAAPSTAAKQRLEEAKKAYEHMSDRLCEDALRYERIYRDELAQRVSAHFVANNHLLRGASSAMRDFLPYSQGLTLNWQDMRATRRANIAAAKKAAREDPDEDIGDVSDGLSALPTPGSPAASSSSSRHKRDDTNGDDNGSTFENLATDIQRRGSNAASAISSSAKNASKSISDMVTSYGTKAAVKSAAKSAKSPFS